MCSKRIAVVGFSGGVDSSVAALLLAREGFDVRPVYLKSGFARDESGAAAASADALGLPLEITDITAELERLVINPFVESYLAGRTPNPCVLCNPAVKFRTLFARADELGAELVATGHYAFAGFLPSIGRYALGGSGNGNDQSYMLCRLGAELLPRLRFPLYGLAKPAVRALAGEAGVPSAAKPDSMEICFIPGNDFISFIEGRAAPERPASLAGWFVDGSGRRLAPHGGIYKYTVGQRKGLGLALGYPAYVAKIDAQSRDVTLLPAGGEYQAEAELTGFMSHAPNFAADSLPCFARVRHSRALSPALLTTLPSGRARLVFPDLARAPAPGQAAVCYVETAEGISAILGSGTIA